MPFLTHRLLAGAGLTAALCAFAVTAADPLPEGVTPKLVAADVAFLQKGLAKTPEKRAVPTLKAVALLVALYAQNNSDKPGMPALRAQAIKVAEAVAKKDFAAAQAAAAGLTAPAGAGDASPVKLHETAKFDLAELMSTYRAGTVGGLNIEKDVRAQAKKTTDVKLVEIQAGRTAAITEFTKLMPTDKAASNPANKKQWDGFSDETIKLSVEIAGMAAKGDAADKAALGKKLAALDASCTACHNVFRD